MQVQTFGDGPRFSPVTSSDHAGQLWIVTILALVYSTLVSTARAYVKYKMFGIDDILIAFATVRAFKLGFGRRNLKNLTVAFVLDFATRTMYCHLCGTGNWWPWQVQLHHDAGAMGDVFESTCTTASDNTFGG